MHASVYCVVLLLPGMQLAAAPQVRLERYSAFIARIPSYSCYALLTFVMQDKKYPEICWCGCNGSGQILGADMPPQP